MEARKETKYGSKHISTYKYMSVSVCVCKYIFTHTHTHMYIYINTHTYTYICIYKYICIYDTQPSHRRYNWAQEIPNLHGI
jgi:hypothetical protein